MKDLYRKTIVIAFLFIAGLFLISCAKKPIITVPPAGSFHELTYMPKQCIDDPWNVWLANSSIRFIRAPTEEEIVKMYYTQKLIDIKEYKRTATGELTCQACEVCGKGYILTVKVLEKDAAAMMNDGWK
jgi:hypothetical protein